MKKEEETAGILHIMQQVLRKFPLCEIASDRDYPLYHIYLCKIGEPNRGLGFEHYVNMETTTIAQAWIQFRNILMNDDRRSMYQHLLT